MSFARRNALFPRGFRGVSATVVVVVVLAVALRVFAPNLLVTIATPLWRASVAVSGAIYGARASFANPIELQHTLDAVRAENTTLGEENATLKAQLADVTALLGSRSASVPGILAAVLARPPLSPYDSLLIDAGQTAGVQSGAFVEGPGGVPLGKVDVTTAQTARVTLFSSAGIKTEVLIGEHRVPVDLVGSGAGTFSATAPKDSGILVGDVVYSAKSALMGAVVRIDENASSPTATLFVQASVNPFSLSWVAVSRL